MELREEIIDATTDDGEMAVVVKEPATAAPDGGWPAVVIFIDAPGIRPATHDFMRRLAGHGYRVITPDLHHRHGRLLGYEPKDRAADPSIADTIKGWIASMTDDQIQHDLDRALDACAVGDDVRFGTIGFCLGARAVVRTMARLPGRVACGAGWHPSFLVDDAADSPHRLTDRIVAPLYLGIGEADQVQSIAMHRPFLDAVADLDHVDVVTYPGADHGFTWPGYPTYDEAAAEGSWTRTLALLSATLA